VATVLGWLFVAAFFYRPPEGRLHEFVNDLVYRVFSGFPSIAHAFELLYDGLLDVTHETLVLSLFAASLAIPLAFSARMVARARVRAGHADPLERPRTWMAAHPRAATALTTIAPAAAQLLFLRVAWWIVAHGDLRAAFTIALAVLAGVVQVRLLRAGTRLLFAPLLASDRPDTVAISPDEIRFTAVAVTRETKLAVGSLAALSLGVVVWLCMLPVLSLFTDRGDFAVIGSYILVAAASAFAFQRASRIAVGRDGVYVGGTSRARFHAYRDLDEVRVERGDVELVKRGRVVLRLQLHGADATRRDAIVERMREGLARVAEVERDAAAHFVTSRSTEKVADAVRGAGDYRLPSVTPDALWALVEGAGVDATTRMAAAEALAGAGDPGRERLRIAAAHCADPKLRVALAELGEEEREERPEARRSRLPA
jgi:hypothetical protein